MGKGFLLFSVSVAFAVTTAAVAAPAFHAGDHTLFKAAVIAERCFGHRTTLLEEIRLAAALRRETHQEVHSWEVSEALNSARQAEGNTVCSNVDKKTILHDLQSALYPGVQQEGPVRAPQTTGPETSASES